MTEANETALSENELKHTVSKVCVALNVLSCSCFVSKVCEVLC